MSRLAATMATLALALALTAGCGAESSTGGSDGGPGGTRQTKTIDISFKDGSVTPNGDRVEVELGQPVELVVQAQEPGEIHVHSTTEQEFEYGAGTTTLKLTLDKPGVVEVESHDLEVTIVQLEVR